MGKKKEIKICTTFSGTPWVLLDTEEESKQRFQLYNTETQQVKMKSDNPNEISNKYWDFIFHGVMKYKREDENEDET